MVQYMHKHYYIFFSHIWTSILKIHKNYLFSTSLTVIKGQVLKSICCFFGTSFFRYTLTVFWEPRLFVLRFSLLGLHLSVFWNVPFLEHQLSVWHLSFLGKIVNSFTFCWHIVYRLVFIFFSVPHARFSVENY